jgi:ribosomal-protein-alanine N-acetyltransferase
VRRPFAAGRVGGVIRLVRPDLELLDAAVAGDDALARALGHAVVPGWATFTGALVSTRDATAAGEADARWGARFFVAGDPPELVGWGGFKGAPRDGVVELGYEIAGSRRGRGLATAATRAMAGEALEDESVVAVIAHTLPERNASNRVLEKAGFRFDGEADDRGEPVWRFRLARVDAGALSP